MNKPKYSVEQVIHELITDIAGNNHHIRCLEVENEHKIEIIKHLIQLKPELKEKYSVVIEKEE